MTSMATKLSDVERIKAQSRHLRGTLVESLKDPLTGAFAEDDTQLSKFHGIYQQDDRDVRNERKRQRLEPAYSFMIRVRVPGGVCTTDQWLSMDEIARTRANGTIRLTTRQAFQLHGVIKGNLKTAIQGINQALMDTLAACGDVNRNVMCSPMPPLSEVHREVQAHAESLSEHLTPATRAYHEIWLDGKKLQNPEPDVEPIYGDTYLPRKFKSAFVVPPQNDVDVYAQDLGFIAIVEQGVVRGFNVTVGGGMGMSNGETATYPRLADVMGFCTTEQVNAVAEAVVTIQRDFGDRTNRKHARLKYTIDDRGLDWLRSEVERRLGWQLEKPRPFAFVGNGDVYGWQRSTDGLWHYTLFVQNGRILDAGDRRLMTGLRKIATAHKGDFRLTPNQNLIISNVSDDDREQITELLREFGIENSQQASPLRLHSMACVAFPTCGLAMAESERYLPSLIDRIDERLEVHGLRDEAMTIRMTGCPNGCARPYIAEIGLVGKGPGQYNLYLGAGFAGDRLNKLYRENIDEEEILAALDPLFARYARERNNGEHFGDFAVRIGAVAEVRAGKEFHLDTING
ncbi:MAG: NADPH-dependent assimilatory sulfite reductase hemoprotein subunit [Proteobacteria bacterium]|nr:NADPH-dependent assimilatory sulfite reductase hemoprotein subunit [Pseudomonadota bacterium]